MTETLSFIQTLWLHTLVANKEKLGDMKPHWTEVEIESHPGQIKNLVDIVWREGKLHVRVTMLDSWAKIEQAEAMQYILGRVHNDLYDLSNSFLEYPRGVTTDEQIFEYLRCCPTNDALPDVRWRKMQMLHYRHDLPYIELENRPICGICHGRVATGAGAQGEQAVTTRIGGTREVSYRPDIHNECYRYAKLILVPALKLQREREKLKQTAEVDK